MMTYLNEDKFHSYHLFGLGLDDEFTSLCFRLEHVHVTCCLRDRGCINIRVPQAILSRYFGLHAMLTTMISTRKFVGISPRQDLAATDFDAVISDRLALRPRNDHHAAPLIVASLNSLSKASTIP